VSQKDWVLKMPRIIRDGVREMDQLSDEDAPGSTASRVEFPGTRVDDLDSKARSLLAVVWAAQQARKRPMLFRLAVQVYHPLKAASGAYVGWPGMTVNVRVTSLKLAMDWLQAFRVFCLTMRQVEAGEVAKALVKLAKGERKD
jgi:hypothetical protein